MAQAWCSKARFFYDRWVAAGRPGRVSPALQAALAAEQGKAAEGAAALRELGERHTALQSEERAKGLEVSRLAQEVGEAEAIEAVVTSPYNVGEGRPHHVSQDHGAKVICESSTADPSPLASAEWVKFWGYFFGKSTEAEASFCAPHAGHRNDPRRGSASSSRWA